MRQRTIRIYIVLCTVVFIQGVFLIFPKQRFPSEAIKEYKIEAKQDESWPEKVIGDPVALFTLVLTLFTGGLFLATRNLWSATKELVRGAEQSSERQLRAYVTIVSGHIALAPNSFDSYTVHISFKNSGVTPAYNFLTRIAGSVFLYSDIPFHDVAPHEDNQSSILGPGDQFHINADPTPVSTYDLEAVRKKEKAIFVWGAAEYRDIFGKDRFFRYRLRITGHEGTFFDGRVGWTLKPHRTGYEAN